MSSYAEGFTRNVLLPLADNYFQATLAGDLGVLREVGSRPVIFVGNHAGASLPWDNIIFDALLWRAAREAGTPVKLQRLIHPALYRNKLSPFLLPDWWKAMECHEATLANFDLLCSQSAAIFISPEGVAGLTKGHRRAGDLMRFSSSFVHMAKKHDALVVPVTIANSAYLNPYTRPRSGINRWIERSVDWPFVPLGPLVPVVAVPRNSIVAMPARLKYHVHQPICFTDRGPDDLETNRSQAEELRRYMESALAQENDTPRVAMPVVAAWRRRNRRPAANPLQHYRLFWKQHLGRPLRLRERLLFSTPLAGYPLLYKRIERGLL